MIPSTRVRLP